MNMISKIPYGKEITPLEVYSGEEDYLTSRMMNARQEMNSLQSKILGGNQSEANYNSLKEQLNNARSELTDAQQNLEKLKGNKKSGQNADAANTDNDSQASNNTDVYNGRKILHNQIKEDEAYSDKSFSYNWKGLVQSFASIEFSLKGKLVDALVY